MWEVAMSDMRMNYSFQFFLFKELVDSVYTTGLCDLFTNQITSPTYWLIGPVVTVNSSLKEKIKSE